MDERISNRFENPLGFPNDGFRNPLGFPRDGHEHGHGHRHDPMLPPSFGRGHTDTRPPRPTPGFIPLDPAYPGYGLYGRPALPPTIVVAPENPVQYVPYPERALGINARTSDGALRELMRVFRTKVEKNAEYLALRLGPAASGQRWYDWAVIHQDGRIERHYARSEFAYDMPWHHDGTRGFLLKEGYERRLQDLAHAKLGKKGIARYLRDYDRMSPSAVPFAPQPVSTHPLPDPVFTPPLGAENLPTSSESIRKIERMIAEYALNEKISKDEARRLLVELRAESGEITDGTRILWEALDLDIRRYLQTALGVEADGKLARKGAGKGSTFGALDRTAKS